MLFFSKDNTPWATDNSDVFPYTLLGDNLLCPHTKHLPAVHSDIRKAGVFWGKAEDEGVEGFQGISLMLR